MAPACTADKGNKLTRRFIAPAKNLRCLTSALVLLLAIATAACAADSRPDLGEIGKASCRQQQPIVLVFSLPACPFCIRLRQEVLRPLELAGVFPGQALLQEVIWDPNRAVRGFDGEMTNGERLAEGYQIPISPTVLLVDGLGREIGERLIGYSGPDYYSLKLEQTIAAARVDCSSSASD